MTEPGPDLSHVREQFIAAQLAGDRRKALELIAVWYIDGATCPTSSAHSPRGRPLKVAVSVPAWLVNDSSHPSTRSWTARDTSSPALLPVPGTHSSASERPGRASIILAARSSVQRTMPEASQSRANSRLSRAISAAVGVIRGAE